MKKLRKIRSTRMDTVEAYSCNCSGVTCSCSCMNCNCMPNNTPHTVMTSNLRANTSSSNFDSFLIGARTATMNFRPW